MGLLNRTTILWGLVITLIFAVVCVLVAPLLGLEFPSLFIGMIIGLALAGGYLIVRVLNPVEQGLKALNDGSLAEDHMLYPHCSGVLEHARTGRGLVETLSGSANQSAISAAHVSYSADQLKLRLDRQVEEITQMADYAGQITETVRESSEQAAEAATMAHQASATSGEGREALMSAIESVRKVHQQSGENLKLIQNLSEKSTKIQSVTSTIEGIAEQTNLLALNAAIEAARAGEQGRGFAVVADEVRTLASRTQESTQEINNMISRLQEQAVQAVSSMEQNARNSETTSEMSKQASETIASISSAVSTISEMNLSIAGAVEEQSVASNEISSNIVQIAEASRTISENATRNDNTVTSLAESTRQLNSLIERFKV
jgi:methyl-accepting chemotaxis protein